MDKLEKIKILTARAADYLYQNRICEEDHLAHNGRRAYVWPLLKWLYRRNPSKERLGQAAKVADELGAALKRNPSGDLVIFPGLQHRRNYSTNAIDCGIFVDSFYDFLELLPGRSHPLEPRAAEIAANYILKKITGHKDVHDQYLWAATGLAHWLKYNLDDPEADKYREALEETLNFWVSHQEKDGYSPYMNSDKYMGGITPYYFSRRIAFAWYILEQAGLNRSDIEQKLVAAGNFLAKLLKPDGTKAMDLEAKRYYFWGPYEAGSHPYDIYVFAKTFEKTKNDFWIKAAAISLKRLAESQLSNGAIRSRSSGAGLRDWQCDTMRTGHIAWLTRLPDEFLEKISNSEVRPLATPYNFSEAEIGDRLILIGNQQSRLHFVTKKGPLVGYAGERSSGLVISIEGNVNNLRRPYLFHYRGRGNPLIFLKKNWSGLGATFQYAFFHAWDCLYYKKAFPLALAFVKDSWLGYLWTGLFTRSTEFATEISGLKLGRNYLSHDLLISDLNGSQKKVIGRRRISWADKEKFKIEDDLITDDRLKIFLPDGLMKIRGPRRINFTYP